MLFIGLPGTPRANVPSEYPLLHGPPSVGLNRNPDGRMPLARAPIPKAPGPLGHQR